MKLLGVDFGTKRIGFATGDTEVSLAFPLRTAVVRDVTEALDSVVSVVREENPDVVVIGVPYRLVGGAVSGDIERAALDFAERVKNALNVPVEIEDERFTSAIADRLREQTGAARKDFDRDATAAAAILETYMTRKGLRV